MNNKYRGAKRRRDRKDKHNRRAAKEQAKMKEIGKSIEFEYWGWEQTDKSPFLWIRLYFDEPILPVNFISAIETFLNDLFDGHIQGSEVPEQEADQEIASIG